MKSKKTGFKSIDEYFATFRKDVQKIMEQLRRTIKAAALGAKEKISYQIAAFELNGRNLIHYAAWKNHVSIYPIPSGSEAFIRCVAQHGFLKVA